MLEKGVDDIDLRAKREAVIFRGLPLFFLSFQTLGKDDSPACRSS